MADIVLGGPLAVDIFLIANGWIAQNNSDDDNDQRETGKGADGDVIASELFGGRNDVSSVLMNFGTSGNLVLPPIGQVLGGFFLLNWNIVFNQKGWPTMTLTGHQHDQNAHVDGTLNEYSSSLVIPAGFGVPIVFAVTDSVSSYQSLTYTLEMDHEDQDDNVGEHLAGESAAGRELVEATFWGTPVFNSVIPPFNTFDLKNTVKSQANETGAFDQTTVSWERDLARD